MGFGLYRKEMTITYFVKTLMELTFYVSISEYVFECRTNISLHELMNQNIKRKSFVLNFNSCIDCAKKGIQFHQLSLNPP